MKKVERRIWLDEDAATLLLQLAGGPRKQGDFLSTAIRDLAQQRTLSARIAFLEEELARVKADVAMQEPPHAD